MSAVPYFTAVLARIGSGWKARDVEVDDAEDLHGLADSLRTVAVDDQPVLAVVEHEDEWFALVRVDGEEDPRLFVSDLGAAIHSHYGDLLAPAADVNLADDEDVEDDVEHDEESQDDEDADPKPPPAWAGECDLLEDLGVPGTTLKALVQQNGDDPGAVLAEVGETVGFGDLLEALR
jgi:putative tRNA adenosine deaminase-associated protein